MKGKRYTEQQILDILGQLEAGTAISDLTRLHGVAMTTIYRWKARYGGMSKDEKEEIPPAGRRTSPPEETRR